jgi:hypothetical protein
MSMIFKFRALSDEADDFVRDYEVSYDMNLREFHGFICDNLDFDDRVMSSFFLSDGDWDRGKEYTLIDMGQDASDDVAPMDKVSLGQIIHNSNDRLIFQFDAFGNRALYLELIGTGQAVADVDYPHVSKSEGDAPEQFDATAVDEQSMFDEAFEEFGDFEGDDYYEDEF